jgi:hypothetical protein
VSRPPGPNVSSPGALGDRLLRNREGSVPADEFLRSCPVKVRARLLATLDAVAEAPPPAFSGGGQWGAMHGEMAGYYEVRAGGPNREQFRLFCLLENARPEELARRGLAGPAIAVLTGMRKKWMATFTPAEYAAVRRLGEDHLSNYPRRIAQ